MSEKKPWRVRLKGPLGTALERFCHDRLMSLDFERWLEPYRFRTGRLCGKDVLVWGQCVNCALRCLPYIDGTELLERRVKETVSEMIALQTPEGEITAYPEKYRFQEYDMLSRRYILNALLRAAALPRAPEEIRSSCIRMTDHLISLVGPGKRSILHCGKWGGLDSSSILDAVTGVYRLSGEERFLEFARYIARSGASQQHNIFQALESGLPPSLLGNGCAVGITECFKGLCELGKCDPEYKEKAEKLCLLYMERIAAEELLITGTGGGGSREEPCWNRGAFDQTAGSCGAAGFSTVTASCLEYFSALASFTDPLRPLALAERSFYNALLGAWELENAFFNPAAPFPLTRAVRHEAAEESHLYDLLRGAEALCEAPRMAMTPIENGAVLNFYEDMEAHLSRKALIRVTGGFPGSSRAEISIRARHPFTISLRIPEYCTQVCYCNCPLEWKKNSFLTITRPWEEDEILSLDFDPEVKHVFPADGSFYHALLREPLVLAAGARGVPAAHPMAETVYNRLTLTDYASAGRSAERGEYFTVWFKRMFPDYLSFYFKQEEREKN